MSVRASLDRAEERVRRRVAGELDARDHQIAELKEKADMFDQLPQIDGLEGRPWPVVIRKMVFESLAPGLSPSEVAPIITMFQETMLPHVKDLRLPGQSFIRRARRELRIVVETLAAYVAAKAAHWRQMGVDGT